MARLTLEQDNLRAALEWSRGDGSDSELRLAAALAPLWGQRASAAEAVTSLRGANERGGKAPSLARAEVLSWLGWFELLPDPRRARWYFEEALAAARALGPPHLIARITRQLAWAGDALEAPLPELQHVLEQGLIAAQSSGDARVTGLILSEIGWFSFRQGNVRDGKHQLAGSLRMLRALGAPDPWAPA